MLKKYCPSTVYFIVLFVFSFFSLLGQNFINVAPIQGLTFSAISTDNWGSGISFYDFDQDGWDDLCFAKENGVQEIYRNDGGNLIHPNFSISNFGQTKHLLWVDYNNDDFLDIFITTKLGNINLLENDGNFNFTDKTLQAGLATIGALNYGASFADYDRDGDLDLYVCKYAFTGDSLNLRDVNNLYRNNGDGTFTDQTFVSGTSNGIKASFQSVWFDYDLDGWIDLFVINDRFAYKNALYHNNGDGSFTDLADSLGLALQLNNPMTASIADFENDGDLDVFISNTSIPNQADKPQLMLNQNNGLFEDKASSYSLLMENTTWGGLWLDYNNNGWQDLYVATAFLDYGLAPKKNYFFRNNYPFPFQQDSNIFIGNHIAHSHAVARGDLNNDGFYEIAAHNVHPYSPFLWSNSGNGNNYIKISLKGTVSNRQAIGSWIKVYAGNIKSVQYTMCGENYLGQNSQHHIFGVGQETSVDSVVVVYPSGIKDVYIDLPVNNSYLFTEGVQNEFNLIYNGSIVLCQGDSFSMSAPQQFIDYQWSTGSNSQSITVFQGGSYFCIATDIMGTQYYSDTLNLNFFIPPIINPSVDSVSCFGESDGQISLQVLNSSLDYEILWSTGDEGDTLRNIGLGSYGYLYLDSASCKLLDTLQVYQPFPLNIQAQISNETQDSLGSISLVLNGGNSPYQIFLDSILSELFIDSLTAGTYSLRIQDSKLCDAFFDFEIEKITDSLANSIQETLENIVSIFPSPVQSYCQILCSKELQSIVIMDLTGKENNLPLSRIQDLSIYPPGVYILKVQAEGVFFYKLFEISH